MIEMISAAVGLYVLCAAIVALLLYYLKGPQIAAGVLALWALVELMLWLTQTTAIDQILIQALRLAYDGFIGLGLGYFMLIFGTLAVIMIWVFDRW
jgi:hypothetical protein